MTIETRFEVGDLNALNRLNPYLNGVYSPVQHEATELALEVEGEIPRDLYGAYVRNGPNPVSAPQGMHHWFDGDGMLHAIWFENGRAEYRNRYIGTADYRAERAGTLDAGGIMAPAAPGRVPTPYKDTANTDVLMHGGALLALWYISGRPVRIDARTLETIRTETFGGKLPKNVSAHAKTDPKTGELLFFDYELYRPFMSAGIVSAAGELTHFTEIELPGPRLPHDMAITENHMILMDLPVVFTEEGRRRHMWQIHSPKGLNTRFGVLPRDGRGDRIRWFEAAPCYIYHGVNAWEEGDEIVFYACKMVPNGITPGPEFGAYAPMVGVLALQAVLCEWRLDLRTGQTHERQIDDRSTEFPVVNNAILGRKGRYSYHVSLPNTVVQRFDGLVKYDLERGTSEAFMLAPGVYGSEPAFAPRLGATAEDDGYVVSFLTDEAGRSEVLVLDARHFGGKPLARVKLPRRVPAGFHGTWAPGEAIAAA